MSRKLYLSDFLPDGSQVIAIEDIPYGQFAIYTDETRSRVRAFANAPSPSPSLVAGVSEGIKAGINVADGERLVVHGLIAVNSVEVNALRGLI